MNACSRGSYGARDKSPRGDSWGSADRANHKDSRGKGLRESAKAAGDMVGGGSLVFS